MEEVLVITIYRTIHRDMTCISCFAVRETNITEVSDETVHKVSSGELGFNYPVDNRERYLY
jgi:hypothetical protein